MKRHIKMRFVVALVAALLMLCTVVLGFPELDPTKHCAVTIKFEHKGSPVPGVPFSLYRVASVSGTDPTFTDLAPFTSKITIPDDQKGWSDLALTLKSYAIANEVEPSFKGSTDANGLYTIEDLETGLYLIVGEDTQVGKVHFTLTPFMLCLPSFNQPAMSWVYDFTGSNAILPKYTYTVPPEPDPSGGDDPGPSDDSDELTILKAWSGDDWHTRPEKISITLYRNGTVYQTATLNEANSWRAYFNGLPVGSDWTVTEDVPDGYTVSMSQQGSKIVLTNTRSGPGPEPSPSPGPGPETTPPPSPQPGGTPPRGNPPDSGTRRGGGIDGSSGGDGSGGVEAFDMGGPGEGDFLNIRNPGGVAALPQLGLLWWPVPVLMVSGLLCVLVGLLIRRFRHREE